MGDFNFQAISHVVEEYNLHSCVYCQEFIIDITQMNLCKSEVSSEEVKAACDSGCIFIQECSRTATDTQDRSIELMVENGENGKLIFKSFCLGPWIPMEIRIIGLGKNEPSFDSKLAQGDRPLAIHPCINDNSCFHNIRKMLQECRNHHKSCERTALLSRPRRLIDVWYKRNDSVQVIDTESLDNSSWAALSYCWGEGKPSGITTKGNIEARRIQLALWDLPLTIRDAIHVCRQLNIQYLWIDSICIVQDDATDTVAEIAKMAAIYQDAIITISASCASSAEKGFLEVRTPYPPGIALPVRTGNGYAVAQLIKDGYRLRPEPIDARAWTFQERILSTRFISFTTNGVDWKCSQSHCNFDKHGQYLKPKVFDLNRIVYRNNRWRALVGGYSGRRLGYLKDRPIAFAGVAETYCQANSLNQKDYVAGLWRQTLLKDLLWHVYPSPNHLNPLHVDPLPAGNTTEDPYIAPSWSWVSALYPVCWLTDNVVETAEVISTQIELVQPKLPFGAVKNGRIRLLGRLHHDQHSIDWSSDVTRAYQRQSDSHTHKRVIFTTNLDDLEGEHIWFFEIGVLQDARRDEQRPICEEDFFCEEESFKEIENPRQHISLYRDLAGLMLLSTGKKEQFTRVGLYKEEPGRTDDDDFFDKSCKWCTLNKERKLTEIEIV